MDLEKQVGQLEAQLEGKDAEIRNLTDRVQELGAFKAEALNAREAIAEHLASLADLEGELARVKQEAATAVSEAKTGAAKAASSAKKVEAAQKMAEAVRVFLG